MSLPSVLIFDMGNVLLRYDPDACLYPYIPNEPDRSAVRSVCFESAQWAMLDAGTISYEAALAVWKEKLPVRLHRIIDEVIDGWHLHMTPMPGMEKLVQDLSSRAVPMYLLSNVSCRFTEIRKNSDVFDRMRGLVLSYEEKICKPSPAIYRRLLDRFQLRAEDCLFIDDMQQNVDGAVSVGMRGIRFDGDAQALRRGLGKMGFSV